MKMKKVRASTLILVLVILFVAAILMLFTMSAVVYQSKLVKTQQQKSTADLFAESSLNILSNEFLSNPTNFINNAGSEQSLEDMGVCSPTSNDIEKKCKEDSKVYISKLKYILAYRLKHGETIQVDLANKGSTPTQDNIDIEFSNPSADNNIDRLLITGYYYDNNNRLKTTGSCFVNFKQHITYHSCVGYMSISDRSVPQGEEGYGDNRFNLSFTSQYIPHFIRIKGIYSDSNKETWISVTGPNYTDLPLYQEVVLKADVFSYDANNEVVESKVIKTLFVHSEMPEVMDWVFYNGANASVVK